jgi:hypothetical protein
MSSQNSRSRRRPGQECDKYYINWSESLYSAHFAQNWVEYPTIMNGSLNLLLSDYHILKNNFSVWCFQRNYLWSVLYIKKTYGAVHNIEVM